MPVTLRQSATADIAFQVSLPGVALAGSLLIACYGRNDISNLSGVVTAGWAQLGPNIQAHETFGGISGLFWKAAAGGEQTVEFATGAQDGKCIIAEFTGLAAVPALLAAGSAAAAGQVGQAISLASGAPGAPALVVGAVADRLNNAANASIVPGANVNRIPVGALFPTAIGNNFPCILWRESTGGSVTLAATQSGDTQDGFRWGMQIGAWSLPGGGGFAGEPGGGIW